MHAIVEAHAFADVAERAYRQRDLDGATRFARSAWRTVQRDDRPAAVEAFIKASRTESWAWHHLDYLDRAERAARRAVGHAHRLAPRSQLLAWSQIRLFEVWGIRDQLERAQAGASRLATDVEGVTWGGDVALICHCIALGAAVKQHNWDAADAAERGARRTLAALGDSHYERLLRTNQALHAMHRGRTAKAHDLLDPSRQPSQTRASDLDAFLQAHLHFLDHQPDTGELFLYEAVVRARERRHRQSLRAALTYMRPFVSDEIRLLVGRQPLSDGLAVKLNLN